MYAEFASPNASQHSAKCEINLPEDKATGGWVHLRFLGGNVNSLGVLECAATAAAAARRRRKSISATSFQ